MAIDSSSATNAIQETRQHTAAVTQKVIDLMQRALAVERKATLLHDEMGTLADGLNHHLAEELARVTDEIKGVETKVVTAGEDLVKNDAAKLKDVSKALHEVLDADGHSSEAWSAAMRAAVAHVRELSDAHKAAFEAHEHELEERVEHAHTGAHGRFATGLDALATTVSTASDTHEHGIGTAFTGDFHAQREEVHAQIDTTATHATQMLTERGTRLHDGLSHDVDNLGQHHEQTHGDLMHRMEALKGELSQLGAAVTGTTHAMADGVDVASLAMSTTSIGITEVVKIVAELEHMFKDVIDSFV